MYLRRHNYDKAHRCPGWSGGGWRDTFYDTQPDNWHDYGRTQPFKESNQYRRHWWQQRHRCSRGMLTASIDYDNPWWSWRSHRCSTCDVRTIPYITRHLDWTWWHFKVTRWWNWVIVDTVRDHRRQWIGDPPWWSLWYTIWRHWFRNPVSYFWWDQIRGPYRRLFGLTKLWRWHAPTKAARQWRREHAQELLEYNKAK